MEFQHELVKLGHVLSRFCIVLLQNFDCVNDGHPNIFPLVRLNELQFSLCEGVILKIEQISKLSFFFQRLFFVRSVGWQSQTKSFAHIILIDVIIINRKCRKTIAKSRLTISKQTHSAIKIIRSLSTPQLSIMNFQILHSFCMTLQTKNKIQSLSASEQETTLLCETYQLT